MGELIKVRLLNDGGYMCMSEVKFPVDVNVQLKNTWGDYVFVPALELERIGCDMDKLNPAAGIKNWSFLKGDFEIIND